MSPQLQQSDAYRRYYSPNIHERELEAVYQKIFGAYVKQRNMMWEDVGPGQRSLKRKEAHEIGKTREHA